jgi:hypothetical protein
MNKETIHKYLYSQLKEFIGKPKNEETKLAILAKFEQLYQQSIDSYEKFKQAISESTGK